MKLQLRSQEALQSSESLTGVASTSKMADVWVLAGCLNCLQASAQTSECDITKTGLPRVIDPRKVAKRKLHYLLRPSLRIHTLSFSLHPV